MAVSLPPRQGVMTLTMIYSDVLKHVGLKGGDSRVAFYDGEWENCHFYSTKTKCDDANYELFRRVGTRGLKRRFFSSRFMTGSILLAVLFREVFLLSMAGKKRVPILFPQQKRPYYFVVVFLEREKTAISLPPRQGMMTLTMNYADVSEHGVAATPFTVSARALNPPRKQQQPTRIPPIINQPDPKTPSTELISSSTSSEKVITSQKSGHSFFLTKPALLFRGSISKEGEKMAVSLSPTQGVMTPTMNYSDVLEHVGLKEREKETAISLPPRQGVMTLTMNYSDVSEHVELKGEGVSRVTFYDGEYTSGLKSSVSYSSLKPRKQQPTRLTSSYKPTHPDPKALALN
ncbi:hypothetical protein CEXT_276641 [Caerostris extrusa]|uniref:Uncharacterized protein n=1 Tax=Caerostris extrusa TaxID=172846 RepID=A0AAV4XEH4_CAEEX|nr:hypothetical protein CEXT_276641 [Caerostris extrusa]